jgi:hypothetical protein
VGIVGRFLIRPYLLALDIFNMTVTNAYIGLQKYRHHPSHFSQVRRLTSWLLWMHCSPGRLQKALGTTPDSKMEAGFSAIDDAALSLRKDEKLVLIRCPKDVSV